MHEYAETITHISEKRKITLYSGSVRSTASPTFCRSELLPRRSKSNSSFLVPSQTRGEKIGAITTRGVSSCVSAIRRTAPLFAILSRGFPPSRRKSTYVNCKRGCTYARARERLILPRRFVSKKNLKENKRKSIVPYCN